MENMHEHYMQAALTLAEKGLGTVEPNPAVGCVVVKDGQIIGYGFHRQFGGPHAEVEALADCRAKGHDPAQATLYVTLEPCCHTGKTGPCSKALIAAGIQTVYVAAQDPTEKVAGKGIAELKNAGLTVYVGLLQKQAEQLNAPFFKHARTGRPWVILKWAQSIDGKLAWKNPPADNPWISNEKSRQDVQRLRRRVQGILAGIDTVIADNPKLTVRIEGQPISRPPLRIVLDSKLRMPWDCRLITVPDAPTLIVTTHPAAQTEFQQVKKFNDAGIEVLAVGETDHRCDLPETLTMLGQTRHPAIAHRGRPDPADRIPAAKSRRRTPHLHRPPAARLQWQGGYLGKARRTDKRTTDDRYSADLFRHRRLLFCPSQRLVLFMIQHTLAPQEMVVMLGETVGFVTDVLQQLSHGVCRRQANLFAHPVDVKNLFPFGNGHQRGHRGIHLGKRLLGGMKLPQPAVNQHHIRPQFLARHRPLIPPGHNLLQAGIIIHAGNRLDLEPPIAVLKRLAVDKLHHRTDRVRPPPDARYQTLR